MYPDFNKKIMSQRLKELRERVGLTQSQVAEQLKVRNATISDYERGRVTLPIDRVIKLANLYQCSIEQIVGLDSESKDRDSLYIDRLIPLVTFGIFGGRFQKIEHEIVKDPVIMAHLGINEVPVRHNLFSNVIKNLTKRQRHVYTLELLKYLHSLIAADKKFSTEELAFAEFVQNQLAFNPSASELASIRRAGKTEYLGGSIEASFPSLAIKRFTLWIMNVLAIADREYHPLEKVYIRKVAKHLKVDSGTAEFIERNSIKALEK